MRQHVKLRSEAESIVDGADQTGGAVGVGGAREDASAGVTADVLAASTRGRGGAVGVGGAGFGAVSDGSAACAETREILETSVGGLADPAEGNGTGGSFGGANLAASRNGTFGVSEATSGARSHTEEAATDIDARASARTADGAVEDRDRTDAIGVGKVGANAEEALFAESFGLECAAFIGASASFVDVAVSGGDANAILCADLETKARTAVLAGVTAF